MRLRELMVVLEHWDAAGVWTFSSNTLKLLFPGDDRARLKALSTHQNTGLIVRVARGLYINPRARCLPDNLLAALVSFLRPWDLSYLSMESALSEAGWISQIPSRLTLMTTGRSQTFQTPYGTLEFVHTARRISDLRPHLNWDERQSIWIATPNCALRDLRRVGRNLDLVTEPTEESYEHAHTE